MAYYYRTPSFKTYVSAEGLTLFLIDSQRPTKHTTLRVLYGPWFLCAQSYLFVQLDQFRSLHL